MQDFRRLLVWQRAHALALSVDTSIRSFPRRGSAVLRSQLARAADSVPTNIVEGCGAATQREFARYLDIAIKSASEVQYHLIAAGDRGVMEKGESERMIDEVVQVRRMLHGLRKKVRGEGEGGGTDKRQSSVASD